MSPNSARKAEQLGYTNVKVYHDGLPSWNKSNYSVLSAQFLKEAWIDKDIPHVLLDARNANEASKGFIKGAVTFPAEQAAALVKKLELKQKNTPIIVYDENQGAQAVTAAKELIKEGYFNVKVLTGGFAAWQSAKFEAASGKLAEKATYVPKPRPGEISVAEFEKYAAQLPANIMIIDVRNTDEGNAGMLKTARLIPAEEIKDRGAEIPKDKLIITHCSTGIRAEMAYHTLKEMGYTNVKFVNAKIDFEKNGSYKITKE